ncbi:hypothetical protein CCR75_001895 [Bremia lactucae]|uniref:Uncharacterized protein n=1 Tax=Bremia lactucae TaxID=4779 RepID=A0A976ID61_BRELC|nr:hypothetical protein CCR75_001895 [Bremia lactucae]
MAVGMTLNQRYAPSSATPNVNAVLSPPHGRSPRYQEDAKIHHANVLSLPPQQMDRIYQMPFLNQSPYAPLYPSSSTAMNFHPLAKPGPSISEDYAADPLPFEYSRKYSPSHRDDGRGSISIVTSSAPMHYNNSYGSHSDYAPPPSSQRLSPYHHLQYPEPRTYHHSELNPQVPRPHFPRSSSTQMYSPMLPLPHQFPLTTVTKKEVDAYPHPPTSIYGDVRGTAQEAMIKVKTPLKLKYWRNGRRNLQCFPSCKVFGDYSAIKIEDLKQHDFMWGKCRGSLITEVTLNSSMTFDDIVLLGRVHSLENIPVAFEEAVIRECMLGQTVEADALDLMKDQWITGERLPNFVQQDANVTCFEFKPKVWKYTEDMTQGKCKRRNVKYYVQFEAFVQIVAGDRRYYACIGSGMSTSFEVGSSRVLARQKRKAASSTSEVGITSSQSDMTSLQCGQSQPLMTHNGNPLVSNVLAMATNPYTHQPAAYHQDGQSRGLPPTFPHPQMMMSPMQSMTPELHYSVSQQLSTTHAFVGEKRKMTHERLAFHTDLSAKMFKPTSGVPQTVPI